MTKLQSGKPPQRLKFFFVLAFNSSAEALESPENDKRPTKQVPMKCASPLHGNSHEEEASRIRKFGPIFSCLSTVFLLPFNHSQIV